MRLAQSSFVPCCLFQAAGFRWRAGIAPTALYTIETSALDGCKLWNQDAKWPTAQLAIQSVGNLAVPYPRGRDQMLTRAVADTH